MGDLLRDSRMPVCTVQFLELCHNPVFIPILLYPFGSLASDSHPAWQTILFFFRDFYNLTLDVGLAQDSGKGKHGMDVITMLLENVFGDCLSV